MAWVVDPELEQRRREVLDLLALAKAEASFMESACQDLVREVSELVGGTQLGDKLVSDLHAAVSFTGDSKSHIDGAQNEARQINIKKWQDSDSQEQSGKSSNGY